MTNSNSRKTTEVRNMAGGRHTKPTTKKTQRKQKKKIRLFFSYLLKEHYILDLIGTVFSLKMPDNPSSLWPNGLFPIKMTRHSWILFTLCTSADIIWTDIIQREYMSHGGNSPQIYSRWSWEESRQRLCHSCLCLFSFLRHLSKFRAPWIHFSLGCFSQKLLRIRHSLASAAWMGPQ